jgi:hypothetical protein
MTSYRDELDWAYHGEVYGEAMFAAMAEVVDHPERSAQLGLLTLIERQTKEQLAPLCDREGIERRDALFEEKGRALAQRAAKPNWDWERFLHTFAPLTGQALLRYRMMRDVLAPEGDAATMRALVTHEEVLQSLADGILAGTDDPARPLVAALQGEHRSEAEKLLASTTDV